MKVLLDVNHPGDVHFIKNLYAELILKGHEVLVVASKKPITYELLREYKIPHIEIGSYGTSNISKAINLLWLDIKMFFICLRFKPDVMLGTVSFRIAHIGWLLRIRTFCFDDTEHAREQTRLITPFTKYFVTPINYKYDFGEKHIRYEGYHELAYLHPKRYMRRFEYLDKLNLKKDEKYTVVRFVSWNATHDTGGEGISEENKLLAVNSFLNFGRVFITSELPLSPDLEPYRLTLPVGEIHDLLAGASLIFGESSTMASEAACLGVPAIFIDDFGRCYTDEQEERYGLVYNYKIQDQVIAIKKGVSILIGDVEKQHFIHGYESLIKEKIDVTSFQMKIISH